MKIDNNIMKITEEKEKEKQNLKRCLAVNICPKCGDHLNASSDNIIRDYECVSCGFKIDSLI